MDHQITNQPMTQAAYAKRRGVTAMAVSRAIRDQRLVKSIVRDAAGTAKIADADLADAEWLSNIESNRGPVTAAAPSDVNSENARLKKWQANAAELEYKKEANELLDKRVVEREWSLILSRVKTKALALPGLAKQQIPELSIPGVETLEGLIRNMLEELSDDS